MPVRRRSPPKTTTIIIITLLKHFVRTYWKRGLSAFDLLWRSKRNPNRSTASLVCARTRVRKFQEVGSSEMLMIKGAKKHYQCRHRTLVR